MKKLLLPMMVVSLIAILYAGSGSEKNLYIMIPAIAVFMYGMMTLSAKVPSKHQEKEEDNV